MPWFQPHLLPVSVFILLPGTFIFTYIISIVLGHVEVAFPYISDTGTHAPESCIFSQMLNIVSFLIALTIYVRYKQIEQYYRDHLSMESARVLRRNWLSLGVGLVACFGLSVVANFQETNVFRVHMVGAMMSFGCGTLYCWLQTWLSFKMLPLVNSLSMAWFRFFLSALMTCTFTTSSILGPYAFRLLEPGKDPTKWEPGDGGYTFHVISSIAEWTSAMSLDIFILTFAREMHKIAISSPTIILLVENVTISSGEQFYNSEDVEVVRAGRRSSAKPQRNASQGGATASPSTSQIIH